MNIPGRLVFPLLGLTMGAWLGIGPRKEVGNEREVLAKRSMEIGKAESELGALLGIQGERGERLARILAALKVPNGLESRFELAEAMQGIQVEEIKALAARAEKLPAVYRKPLLAALLERWLELDLMGARQWLLSHQPSGDMLLAWARHDPEAALADAVSGRAAGWTAEALAEVMRQLAGPNMREQASRLAALAPSGIRYDALASTISKWAKEDPRGALEYSMTLKPDRLRERARAEALVQWAEGDPAGAMEAARSLLPDLKAGVSGRSLLNELTRKLAEKDAKSALEFAASLPEEFRSNPMIGAAAKWASQEPAAALQWCLDNGVPLTRAEQWQEPSTRSSVAVQAMLDHPNETVEWMRQLPEGADRDLLMECAVRTMVDGSSYGERSLGDGATLLIDCYLGLPEEAQERGAAGVGLALGNQPGANDLLKIMEPFPPGELQAAVVGGAMASIYSRNPSAAESALSALPPGPLQDAAVGGIVKMLAFRKPAEAAARAMEIGDPGTRRDALERFVPWWLKQNPEASRAWLDQAKAIPADWVQAWVQRK